MAVTPPPDTTGVDKAWIHGIDGAMKDPRWHTLDSDIHTVLNDYNLNLLGVSGYMPLGFIFVKSMCWTETGANDPAWSYAPMQIGSNPRDKGLRDLLVTRKNQSHLILPPAYRDNPATRLTRANVLGRPRLNIAAGVGYLLLLAAHFNYRSATGSDMSLHQHIVTRGDNFSKIARAEQTTLTELVNNNPNIAVQVGGPPLPGNDITVKFRKPLHPKDIVLFRKASMRWGIAGWSKIDESFAANNYNRGDPHYAQKLAYCEWILKGGTP